MVILHTSSHAEYQSPLLLALTLFVSHRTLTSPPYYVLPFRLALPNAIEQCPVHQDRLQPDRIWLPGGFVAGHTRRSLNSKRRKFLLTSPRQYPTTYPVSFHVRSTTSPSWMFCFIGPLIQTTYPQWKKPNLLPKPALSVRDIKPLGKK